MRQHISHLVSSIIHRMEKRDSLSLKDIMGLLDGRVYGFAILILSFPNCLPIPNVAAYSAITGIPIIILGLEMLIGLPHPWFPQFISKRKVSGKRFGKMLERTIPYLKKIEVYLHPRLLCISCQPMERLLGLAFIILATIMSLPIPFGNFLPGLAMAIMAIGVIVRDGLVVILGLLVGLGMVILMITVADQVFGMIG